MDADVPVRPRRREMLAATSGPPGRASAGGWVRSSVGQLLRGLVRAPRAAGEVGAREEGWGGGPVLLCRLRPLVAAPAPPGSLVPPCASGPRLTGRRGGAMSEWAEKMELFSRSLSRK